MKKITAYLIVAACALFAAACSDDDSAATANPAGIQLAAAYTDGLSWTWNAVEGTSAYEVEYTSDEGTKSLQVNEPSLTLSDLSADTDYALRVRMGSGSWSPWATGRTAAFSVSVSSFNILGIETKAAWAPRVAAVKAIIYKAGHCPDVLCVQECAADPMLSDMQTMLADDYDCHVITVTDADPALIFWKRDLFEKTDAGFSDMLLGNSDYASSEYTASRFAHFVRLREKSSGHEFLVYNIHVKTNGSTVSYQKLRYDCLDALCPAALQRAAHAGNIPVIIAGDFNNYLNTVQNGVISAPAVCLRAGFTEAAACAQTCINLNYKTSGVDMDGGKASKEYDGGSRIDYVFGYSARPFSVSRYQTVIDFVDGSDENISTPVASDHHPVNAQIHLAY